MGGKRSGKGEHLLRCVALVICLSISGCAFLESVEIQKLLPQDEPRQHLVRAQKLLSQGDYEASLREDQAALSISASKPPGDEALFNMALIYAHPGNPKKDYVKSIASFKRLIKEYPDSPWSEQARVWVQVIQETENMKRASAVLVHENERLKRAYAEGLQETERLKKVIEQSTKVDIEIGEKKKEKAR